MVSEAGRVLKANKSFLGLCTNNQAEYRALIAALEFAVSLNAREVICHLDSELVVRQLTGKYAVRNLELRKLWRKVQELARCFDEVKFVNVPRTNLYVQRADALVNEQLDEATKQK
jgi:ribonuclease HI